MCIFVAKNVIFWFCSEAPMRAEFLQKRLISAFFGFQWQNLAEILHLFKKYNNIGKVAVKRVSWTDYALWTLGSLDALVKKSSFPFHRSDYLCRESVDAAITHFFCRECCIYVLFCRECRDYALFDVEFYAEFLEEILRNTQNFGRNSAEKIGHWSLWSWALSPNQRLCFTIAVGSNLILSLLDHHHIS